MTAIHPVCLHIDSWKGRKFMRRLLTLAVMGSMFAIGCGDTTPSSKGKEVYQPDGIGQMKPGMAGRPKGEAPKTEPKSDAKTEPKTDHK
jgi:hypothetical protein